jgi:hypothetical protein
MEGGKKISLYIKSNILFYHFLLATVFLLAAKIASYRSSSLIEASYSLKSRVVAAIRTFLLIINLFQKV